MLCGLFARVCCLPAPVSDPDTGPTGGNNHPGICAGFERSAVLWGRRVKAPCDGEDVTRSSSDEEPLNATQVCKIHHPDRRARSVSLAAVKLSMDSESKASPLRNAEKPR